MSVHTNMTLPDAQATPVNQVFSTAYADGITAVWENRAGGIPVGFPTLKTVFKAPSAKQKIGDRYYQEQLQLKMPVMETLGNNSQGLTPPPTIAHSLRGLVTLEFSERSTKPQRADLIKLLIGALQNAQVQLMVTDLDRPS